MQIEKTPTHKIETNQLLWDGHTLRMHERRFSKMIYNWVPTRRRKKFRPRKR